MEWMREMPAMHQAMRRWEGLPLRRRALYGVLAAVLFISIVFFVTVGHPLGDRPFSSIRPDDIVAAAMTATPPDRSVLLDRDEIRKLASLLPRLVVYQPDECGQEYAGQMVLFTLTLADGSTRTVGAYNPFVLLDGVWRRTDYAPCEALNSFGNELLRES